VDARIGEYIRSEEGSMNYFTADTSARRYAQNRPYFHPGAMTQIRARGWLPDPVPAALDVGCGTGQSTLALTEIADRIVGTDLSAAMLAQAPAHHKITYALSAAESLPLPASSFDLLTVARAFHWFDRPRFLAEAHRVLRPNGWLIIYNSSFQANMAENPAFQTWSREIYRARFPSPPRNNEPFTESDAAEHGFQLVEREPYGNDVQFTRNELAHYLMTHSNVLAVIDFGGESADSVFAWLQNELEPFFPAERGTFRFGGTITYLRRVTT
jgi:SAM-dependent methyltransferase